MVISINTSNYEIICSFCMVIDGLIRSKNDLEKTFGDGFSR